MFSTELGFTLEAAYREAAQRKHAYFCLEHLLFALLFDEGIIDVIKNCAGDVLELRKDLEHYFDHDMERLPPSQKPVKSKSTDEEDDENVDIYIVRDADSVMNIKERVAVADWLKSRRAFHVMRDGLQHSELILAGMWGAHRGNIGDMRGRIFRYSESLPKIANYVHRDQHFLRQVIWPIMRGSVKIHDRFFNFMETDRYDASYELPTRMHIGQNDWVHYKRT